MKIIDLFINLKVFCGELSKDNNFKKHILFLVWVSVIFVILWFVKTFYLILSPNHFNDDIALYAELFQTIAITLVWKFLLFLVVDFLAIFRFSVVIAYIAKLAGDLFKIKLKFKDYWKIVCSITVIIIPVIIVQLLLDIALLSKFYPVFSTIVGIYTVVLLVIGVRKFVEVS